MPLLIKLSNNSFPSLGCICDICGKPAESAEAKLCWDMDAEPEVSAMVDKRLEDLLVVCSRDCLCRAATYYGPQDNIPFIAAVAQLAERLVRNQ